MKAQLTRTTTGKTNVNQRQRRQCLRQCCRRIGSTPYPVVEVITVVVSLLYSSRTIFSINIFIYIYPFTCYIGKAKFSCSSFACQEILSIFYFLFLLFIHIHNQDCMSKSGICLLLLRRRLSFRVVRTSIFLPSFLIFWRGR